MLALSGCTVSNDASIRDDEVRPVADERAAALSATTGEEHSPLTK